MPKRSRRYDRETAMMVKRGPDSTSTDMPPAKKAKVASPPARRPKAASPPAKKATDTKATDTKPKEKKKVEVKPAGETSRQMKNIVIAELIREGKVKMTRSCDFSK